MPQLFDIEQDEDGTWSVVHFGTKEVVVLNGVEQRGLDVQDADDLAEALDVQHRITAERVQGSETRN